ITAHYWAHGHQMDLESALKKDMINRGMSAADIERVLQASSTRTEESKSAEEPISDNEYYLVEKMLDEGHSVEEIERLVRAFKSGGSASTAIRALEKARG